jgi:hypothetical protein
MMMLLLLVVMGAHPEGDVHLVMLLPDDLLLIMLSLAACTHHLQRDTQTPTDDTHTGAISSSLCVYLRLRMYI